MEHELAALYSGIGRPSIAPQMPLRAMLQGFCSALRAQLMERMEFDLCSAGSSGSAPPSEAHGDFILAAVAAPDVTFEELQSKLIDAHDARFSLTTIWALL